MPPVGCFTCGSGRKPIGNEFCCLICSGVMLPSLSQVAPPCSFTRTPCCTALRLPDICTFDGLSLRSYRFSSSAFWSLITLALSAVSFLKMSSNDLRRHDRHIGLVRRSRGVGRARSPPAATTTAAAVQAEQLANTSNAIVSWCWSSMSVVNFVIATSVQISGCLHVAPGHDRIQQCLCRLVADSRASTARLPSRPLR